MLCDNCKENEATVHMTSIVNNQKEEQHLCATCASQLQKEGKLSPFSAFASDVWDNQFFNSDFFNNMLYPDSLLRAGHSKRCPGCGITYDEFNKRGKFGCDQCYDTFHDEIGRLVDRLQGSTDYKGRIPSRGDVALKQKRELDHLKEQLKGAVQDEKFEEAARIRDQIKVLEAHRQEGEGHD